MSPLWWIVGAAGGSIVFVGMFKVIRRWSGARAKGRGMIGGAAVGWNPPREAASVRSLNELN